MQRKSNVAEHYNQIEEKGMQERRKSKIITIREINNFIKTKLINRYSTEKCVIFDMGCGKGGDLSKLKFLSVKHYYGCDIAEKSLESAIKRATMYKYKTDFIQADFTTNNIQIQEKANLVMSHFSFHYAFASEKALDKALKNVSRNIDENGVFLLTIPNNEVLERRFSRSENGVIQNNLYKAVLKKKIDSSDVDDVNDVYGKEYDFYLQESVTGCQEYLVDVLTMKRKLAKYNLIPEMKQDFLSILNREMKNDPETFKRMVKGVPTKEEIQVIELYMAVAFRKVTKNR